MLAGCLTFLVVFYIGFYFFRKRNPYISAHKRKWQNEKDYEEYLKWLDRNKGDNPLKKVDTEEDAELLKEVEQILKHKK